MRDPKIILDILSKRSINNLELNNIYPLLYKEGLYELAFNELHTQKYEITEQIHTKIQSIINDLKHERFKWFKYDLKSSYKIGTFNLHMNINEWNNILLQKVLYLILNSIYEPKFLECSHGWRLSKGINTALQRIEQKSHACEFFMQSDIINCFESIDYNILLNIIKKTIKDNRFINLLERMFKNNCFGKDLNNSKTYSGVIKSFSLSTLLMNIYLNELDTFIQDNLMTKYHNNLKRKESKEYRSIRGKISNEQKKLKRPFPRMSKEESLNRLKIWRKQLRNMRFIEGINITESRRLCYIRYGNSFLLSFTGPFKEAIEINNLIKEFVNTYLHLQCSESINKVFISLSNRKPVRFLNYNIITQWDNAHVVNHKRSLNGSITFMIPNDVIYAKKRNYTKNNKPIHLGRCLASPVFDIISLYQSDFINFCQYYKFARNQTKLTLIKYIMETSLTKTLSNKLKISVHKVYKKYSSFKIVNGYKYKVISDSLIDNNGNKHVIFFGAIPFKKQPFSSTNIEDIIHNVFYSRSSFESKVKGDNTCILCNTNTNIQLHHLNHIKNICKNSKFIKRLSSLKRKVIPLCKDCHILIHKGLYDKDRLS